MRAGDLAQAQAMLKARPELANMQMSYGDEHRPLHYAVMSRLPEMARLLIWHGADARSGVHPHRDATTALTIAIERGYGEIAAIIQEEEQRRCEAMSASPAAPGSQGELNDAISGGDETRAMAMLEADPSLVQACDRDGWTPRHVASAVRNPELVTWLLEHGADVNRRGRDGRTARSCRGGKKTHRERAVRGRGRDAAAGRRGADAPRGGGAG